MNDIRYTTQQTTQSEIYLHLRDVDNSFMHFLSSMMDLENFSFKIYKKLYNYAEKLIEKNKNKYKN